MNLKYMKVSLFEISYKKKKKKKKRTFHDILIYWDAPVNCKHTISCQFLKQHIPIFFPIWQTSFVFLYLFSLCILIRTGQHHQKIYSVENIE